MALKAPIQTATGEILEYHRILAITVEPTEPQITPSKNGKPLSAKETGTFTVRVEVGVFADQARRRVGIFKPAAKATASFALVSPQALDGNIFKLAYKLLKSRPDYERATDVIEETIATLPPAADPEAPATTAPTTAPAAAPASPPPSQANSKTNQSKPI